MSAAFSASDETVSSLLSWGANPDETDANGDPALIFAIRSKCSTTINLLAPLTQANLGGALRMLVKENIKLTTEELRQLLERMAKDKEATIKGLEAAAMFGSNNMVAMIAEHTRDHSIFEDKNDSIWIDAVKSDSEATVSALLLLLPNPPLEVITLARERGVPGVVRMLLPDTKTEREGDKEALRNAVHTNTAQLLDQIPRDVEFTYNQNMDKLRPLLGKNTLVPYTILLKQLHLPKAHIDDKESKLVCPSDCVQKQSCLRIRETLSLVNIVAQKLGERNKMLEGIEVSIIGSTREGSRAFYNDEVDIHLLLNHDLRKRLSFSSCTQDPRILGS